MQLPRAAISPLCAICGDVLGAYEPIMVLLPDEAPRRVSRAVAKLIPAGIAVHECCYHASGTHDLLSMSVASAA